MKALGGGLIRGHRLGRGVTWTIEAGDAHPWYGYTNDPVGKMLTPEPLIIAGQSMTIRQLILSVDGQGILRFVGDVAIQGMTPVYIRWPGVGTFYYGWTGTNYIASLTDDERQRVSGIAGKTLALDFAGTLQT